MNRLTLEQLEEKVSLLGGWDNFGDVDFLRHGGVFIKKDGDDFQIISSRLFNEDDDLDERSYLFEEAVIDITDSFIDWDKVSGFSGLIGDESDVAKSLAVYDYYGADDISGTSNIVDIETVVERLEMWEIIKVK